MTKTTVILVALLLATASTMSAQTQLPIHRDIVLTPFSSCAVAAAELAGTTVPVSYVSTGSPAIPCIRFDIVYSDFVLQPPTPVPVTWLEFGGLDKFTRADYFLRQVKAAGYAHYGLVWTREETIIVYGF